MGTEVPERTIRVDWPTHTIHFRHRSGALVSAEFDNDCVFDIFCAIALVQRAVTANNPETQWPGVDESLFEAICAKRGWGIHFHSFRSYWSALRQAKRDHKKVAYFRVNGRELDHESPLGSDVFNRCCACYRIGGSVRRDRPPRGLWSIDFPAPKLENVESQQAFAILCDDVDAASNSEGAPAFAGGHGTPDAIRSHVCSFDSFVADRSRAFVGRRFVFEGIERFLLDSSYQSGYFLVTGPPGIGKSALLSKFVLDHKLRIHHFNLVVEGITTPGQALGNICARLISEFALPYEALPERYAESGAFLNSLLHEVSEQIPQSRPLIIAIDALDEVTTEMPAGANSLFLPTSLPDRVYVICTARSHAPTRLEAATLERFALDSHKKENAADLEEYLTQWLGCKGVTRWMKEHSLKSSEFISSMLELSEGSFMYVRHVLPAIDQGHFVKDSIESLPHGLTDYYRRHWERMRHRGPAEFEEVCHPVICVLAAVGAPWPLEDVAQVTKLPVWRVADVIREWHEFLECVAGRDGTKAYRLYHASFADYLSEEVDPGLHTFHRLVADSLLDQADEDDPTP